MLAICFGCNTRVDIEPVEDGDTCPKCGSEDTQVIEDAFNNAAGHRFGIVSNQEIIG